MATLINPKAKDIITLAYIRIGDIALQVSRNNKAGRGHGRKQKDLWQTGFLIRKMLKVIFDHVEFDSATGEISTLYRITILQLNKILNCLVKISDINDYPAVPILLHTGKPIIRVGGSAGATGLTGPPGSDADIDVDSDPDFANIKVTEVAAVIGVTPKTYLLGYDPYTVPVISLTITTGTTFEIGVIVANTNFRVRTTKGQLAITTVTITDDAGLDASLQGILDLPTVNGVTQPVDNIVSKTNISTNLTVTAQVSDGAISPQNTASMNFYYPYLSGNSPTVLTGGDAYTILPDKLIAAQGNKTVTFNGTDEHFYHGFVDTYPDIVRIYDGSGFRVENDWEKVPLTVQASGLDTNWLVGFIFYKTKIKTTIIDQDYTFEHA
jgi:hypothetical protein